MRFRFSVPFSRRGSGPGVAALAAALSLVVLPALGRSAVGAPSETIHRATLSNGMRVFLVENHSKPLVGVCLFVDGGSRTETAALSGLSHYYEHLIFRGGSTRQRELEFRKEMQRIGEETGGYTTNDYTCYGFTAPVGTFDEALWRSADAWMNLRLTQAKVSKERQVVLEEFNQGEDRPDYKVYYQIERLMFRDHPYKRDTIGLRDVLEHASLATFRTFYRERYVPNQMILAVVGDFERKSMLAKLERSFAAYPRGRDSFEQGIVEAPQDGFRMGAESMKTPNTWIYLGFHTPPQSDRSGPAVTVLATLLGRGNSSRLYRVLKERENLVTSIDADFEVRKDPGMFLIGSELPPQNEARVFGLVRGELRRLATERVQAAELDRVKSMLLNRYAFGAETFFRRAERLCQFALMSDVSLEPLYPSLIEAVTAEDIQRLAAQLFAAQQASYSVVRPEGFAGPADAEIQALVADWSKGWPSGGGAVASAGAPPRREVLPNGVTLILKEDHAAPLVACVTMARGGLWIEPEGLAGVSNMATLLLRRGAAGLTARQISEGADGIGMQLSTGGGPDYALISWQVPSRHLPKAWELYRAVALHPTFPAAEIAKVREDLVRQLKSLGDRPFEYTNLEFQKRLFRSSPYRRSIRGDTTSLAKIRAADLRRAYETMFTGSNLVIAVVGDFDSAWLLSEARRAFAAVRKGAPAAIGGAHDDPPAEKVAAFVAKDQEQVTYNTGWLGCSVRDPDYIPLKAAVSFIGDRLFFKYVYEKGVAYRSWFYMPDRLGQSWATNEMGVTPANFPMASTGVLDDVTQVVRGPMSEAELRHSIEKMLSRHYLGVQENADLADRLAYYEMAGLGFEYAERYPELLKKLTVADVKAAARKYLDPARYTRVAVGKEP